MKTIFKKKADFSVRERRELRETAGRSTAKFHPRTFDPVAYAAALEVLG